jgi:hypothetical protein
MPDIKQSILPLRKFKAKPATVAVSPVQSNSKLYREKPRVKKHPSLHTIASVFSNKKQPKPKKRVLKPTLEQAETYYFKPQKRTKKQQSVSQSSKSTISMKPAVQPPVRVASVAPRDKSPCLFSPVSSSLRESTI